MLSSCNSNVKQKVPQARPILGNDISKNDILVLMSSSNE